MIYYLMAKDCTHIVAGTRVRSSSKRTHFVEAIQLAISLLFETSSAMTL